MFCSSCGAESPEGKKFCPDCGAGFREPQPAVEADTAPEGSFCSECGAESPEGKKFCPDCGAELGAAQPAVQAPPPMAVSPAKPQGEGGKAGSFWKSPAGIALIVIVAVAVLGGVTTGIVFAVKGGSESTGETGPYAKYAGTYDNKDDTSGWTTTYRLILHKDGTFEWGLGDDGNKIRDPDVGTFTIKGNKITCQGIDEKVGKVDVIRGTIDDEKITDGDTPDNEGNINYTVYVKK